MFSAGACTWRRRERSRWRGDHLRWWWRWGQWWQWQWRWWWPQRLQFEGALVTLDCWSWRVWAPIISGVEPGGVAPFQPGMTGRAWWGRRMRAVWAPVHGVPREHGHAEYVVVDIPER